ncbi:hypothetical protein CRE_06845 [Caenorhabditis remanei]|uniref:Uncharacterized protein n=1 Tax=Caenorhabditis remanei TaxID=31234 RepID=E3MZJ5_CAERE|nr:hypothetical protein CRE_06845 [Caenorhabditis remanei]
MSNQFSIILLRVQIKVLGLLLYFLLKFRTRAVRSSFQSFHNVELMICATKQRGPTTHTYVCHWRPSSSSSLTSKAHQTPDDTSKTSRIQRIDKEQSAKIGTLQLPPGVLQIDSLTLRLGIVRYYPDGQTPDWVCEENENGGVEFDVGDFRGLAQAHIFPRRELYRAPNEEEIEEKEAAEQRLQQIDNGSDQIAEEEKEKLQKIIEAFNYRVWISELKYEEYPTVLVENYLMTSGTEPEMWPFGPTMRVANLRAEKRFWNSRDMLLLRDALSLESNFPLKSLETRPRRSAGELYDHLAQKFIINEAPNENLIIKLKCPNVHFKDYTFDSIPFKIIFGILRKDPSKQYTFETSSPRCLEDLIQYCQTDRRLPEEVIVSGYKSQRYSIHFGFPLHGVIDLIGSVHVRKVDGVFHFIINIECQ